MNIMGLKSCTKHESIEETELNRILDKMSNGRILDVYEESFLEKFNKYNEDHYKDFNCLSKNDIFYKIANLLSEGNKVVCDMNDRNGKIGLEILSIHNNFDDDFCYVVVKNSEIVKIFDKYLYNVIYDLKKDEYSLQIQDEYFEKVPIKNDN